MSSEPKPRHGTCWACPGPVHTTCLRCGRNLCVAHEYADPAPNTLWPIKRLGGTLCQPCYRAAEALATWPIRQY